MGFQITQACKLAKSKSINYVNLPQSIKLYKFSCFLEI